jgi:membrane-associated phospholipid phosphatase
MFPATIHPKIARKKLDELARIASPKTIVPMALATSWAMRRRPGAARLAIGTSLAVLVEEVLKRVVRRHRPRLFDRTAWRSFPSGHSAGATAYLVGLGWLVRKSNRPFVFGFAALGVAVVNWLRVRARDHWTSDVVAGDLVGIASLGVSSLVTRGHDASEVE